ncbi:hypothetical protein EEJ35_11650 [Vibrio cholerae]|nr:hypothetical protein EEJ35_11650 [Vibrio cholerae]
MLIGLLFVAVMKKRA